MYSTNNDDARGTASSALRLKLMRSSDSALNDVSAQGNPTV